MSGPNLPFLLQIGKSLCDYSESNVALFEDIQLSFVLIASTACNLWQGDEILHLFNSEVPALILLAY